MPGSFAQWCQIFELDFAEVESEKYYFKIMLLNEFPFSPYIYYDVDSDSSAKIPNGHGFSKIDV